MSEIVAAVDMGSNSFHMVVARFQGEQLDVLDTFGEKVQLAAGLDGQSYLNEETQTRALITLESFAEQMDQWGVSRVVAVGTNTLRVASNSAEFVTKVERVLDCPVRVVSGEEEARLIYQGVSMSMSHLAPRRLVIDIGGGSTEIIVGERAQPKLMRSLQLGCVTFGLNYFKDGAITQIGYDAAVAKAKTILAPEVKKLRAIGWDVVIGSSGSVKSVQQVGAAAGLQLNLTTPDTLQILRDKIIELGHCKELHFEGLRPDRRSIFPAGLAILDAIFQLLKIDTMHFSTAALREGVLYDEVIASSKLQNAVASDI